VRERHYFLVLAFILLTSVSWSQTFLKTIGELGRNESGFVLHRTPGNELFLGGSVGDSALVQRVDDDGNVLWSRSFKPPGEYPKCIFHLTSTPDGTLIGCGNGFNALNEPREGFHFRMDVDGTMLWLRNWAEQVMYSRRMIALSTTEYLLFADRFDMASPTFADLVTARVDAATGDIIWLSDLVDLYAAVPYNDDVISVATIGQSHYAASRIFTNGAPLSTSRVAVSKFDYTGQHQWTNYLLYPNNVDRRLHPSDIIGNNDSLTIAYYGDINGSSSNWTQGLIRMDTLGNVAWARDFNVGASSQEHGTKVIATSFGYLVAGRTRLTNPPRLFLQAISASGGLLWTKSYGAIAQDQDLVNQYASNLVDVGGGFLMTGLVDQGGGNTDILLVRTDIDGEIICSDVNGLNAITTILPDLTFNSPVQEVAFTADLGVVPTVVVDAGIDDICLLDVALGNDTALCNTLQLDAGVANAIYEWQDGTTAQTLDVSESGAYWVRVTQDCCVSSDTIDVEIAALAVIDLGADTTLCQGADLTLQAPQGTWSFLWSDGSTDGQLIVNTADTYWVRVTDGQCVATDTIEVSTGAIPTVDLGPDTVSCDGSGVLLDTGSSDATDWSWSDTSTEPTLQVDITGTYFVEVSSACGTATDTVEVTILDGVLDLGPDTAICSGASLELEVDLPDRVLLWSDGSDGETFIISEAGTYWLDATNAGCTNTDTVVVEVLGPPVIDLGPDTLSCAVPFYILDAGEDLDLTEWSDGSVGRFLVADRSGIYWASLEDQCGVVVDSVRVTFASPVDELRDIALCPGKVVALDPGDALLETLWSTGDSLSVITVGEGEYWYTAMDIVGCPHTDSVRIYIDAGMDGQVYVPNAFSPNNDGFNERFEVVGPERSDFELTIYDRWGAELYRSVDPYQGWDAESGTPQGVYVWTLTYRDRCAAKNALVTKRGHVTLVR